MAREDKKLNKKAERIKNQSAESANRRSLPRNRPARPSAEASPPEREKSSIAAFHESRSTWAGVVSAWPRDSRMSPSANTSGCRRCPAGLLILESGLTPNRKSGGEQSRLRSPSFSTQRSLVFQNCCDGHRDHDSQRDFEKTVSGCDPGGMHGTDEHHDRDGHAG